MILDAETLRARQRDRVAARGRVTRATARSSPSSWSRCSRSRRTPLPDTREAGARAARAAPPGRRGGRPRASCTIGSAGTHPFAMWEDQRIVARPRYRELISALRFVARQEIIFGLHVHVGHRRRRQGDPRRQRHARARAGAARAVGQLAVLARRRHRPRLDPDADLPRLPARRHPARTTTDWADYEQRIGFMVDSGVIEDYTYLWYDVRPHPNFGTVEIRAMDAQTRVEHTLALAALIQAMVKELAEHYEAGEQLARYPYEMLDENKWLAARHGLEGELVDLPERRAHRHARSWRGGSTTACASTPRTSARPPSWTGVEDILEHGNGAAAPARRLRGQPRPARGHAPRSSRRPRRDSEPRLLAPAA